MVVLFQINITSPTNWCYGLDDNSDGDDTTVCDCSRSDEFDTGGIKYHNVYCTMYGISKINSINAHPGISLTTASIDLDLVPALIVTAIKFNEFGKRDPISTNSTITMTSPTYGYSEEIEINPVGRIKKN